MRTTTRSLTLAGILSLALGADARADLTLGLDSLPGTYITFDGTGNSSSPAATISFTKSGGVSFKIASSNLDSVVDLDGSISGKYSYTSVSQISSTKQEATTTGTGTDKFAIVDGKGKSLTGTVSGMIIDMSSTSGAVGFTGILELTDVKYSGKDAGLSNLAKSALNGDLGVTITSNLDTTQKLDLTTLGTELKIIKSKKTIYQDNVESFAYSTPEPSTTLLAGLGALGLIGYGLRRRKAAGI